jgi:hypothetical protein
MQETENMADGMSYRTMNGIDTRKIMSYLEDRNKKSSEEIFHKNRDYHIASADKTIVRLELPKLGQNMTIHIKIL